MTEHTPTPWRHLDGGLIGPRHDLDYLLSVDKRYYDDGVEWPRVEKLEDADFIVRAVNNHAALIKALRRLLGGIEAEENGNQGCLRKAREKAVAALKAAKE